jgi:predicted nucleotidyltransferase
MIEQKMAIDNLIYKIRTGSFMYGTNTETSDEDFGGIFIPKKEYVMGIMKCEQVSLSHKISTTKRNIAGDIDYTVYALPKMIGLLGCNNPNIIEFLYAPKHCILFKSKFAEELIANRELFLSKKAYHTFKGYAYAQRHKLEIKRDNMTGRTELALKYGYDTKFAGHLIRLLIEGLEILVEKNITFPLHQNNLIRDIKLGKYDLTWVLNKAQELEKLIDEAYIKSDLQYEAQWGKINKLQIRLLEEFWKERTKNEMS